MEDFSLNPKKSSEVVKDSYENKEELNMSVSGICDRNGEKIAYVSFSDGKRSAEGVIPDCIIQKNTGFNDEEIKQLEEYMSAELATLKKMASRVNVFDAFLKK